MEREEAKNILQLCRPNNPSDREDPLVAEALACLATDTELSSWFEEQQALDARISTHLESIHVPEDLKTNILAGMRAHALKTKPSQQDESEEKNPVIPFKAWWRNPWIGIAALFVVLMVIAVTQQNTNKSQLATNNSDAAMLGGIPSVVQFLSTEIDGLKPWSFDKRADQASELRTYLTSSGAPSPATLPGKLNHMSTIGCVTYTFQKTKLSMICFKDEAVYHLITLEKAQYPDVLPVEPQVFELEDKAFRLWVEDDQVKILIVHGNKQIIPKII